MSAPDADPVAAALARILDEHRQHVSENFPAPGICVSRCADSRPRWPCGAYRAAEAAEAALNLAADWSQDRYKGTSALERIHQRCADRLREVIRTALAGKEAGDACE